MAKREGDTSFKTNLASAYLMLSLPCSAVKDAHSSLGNNKVVDFIVKTNKSALCLVEHY